MRTAIIGGGFAGLSAAYELVKNDQVVTVFEKEPYVGGLGSGFRQLVDDYPTDWEWNLEQFYHHWFTKDSFINSLINELHLTDRYLVTRPITASFYQGKTYQIDSPLALLRFSPLSLGNRLRTGLFVAIMKMIPNGSFLEKWTVHNVVPKLTGQQAYQVLWEPLMKAKFKGDYQNINLAWLWARIKARTSDLAYFEGGFQMFADALADAVVQKGGQIKCNTTILQISRKDNVWHITFDNQITETFDCIISTVPFPIFAKFFDSLPDDYVAKYSQLKGIGAQVLVLSLKEEFLPDHTYWLNIHEPDWPFLVVAEHTNFMPKQKYGQDHIIYVGDYLPAQQELMHKNKGELLTVFLPYLQKINPDFSKEKIKQFWLWRTPYAQPLPGVNHSEHIPAIKTPLPGVFSATMAQVYPWDRGTNFAVEIGQKAAQLAMNYYQKNFIHA